MTITDGTNISPEDKLDSWLSLCEGAEDSQAVRLCIDVRGLPWFTVGDIRELSRELKAMKKELLEC